LPQQAALTFYSWLPCSWNSVVIGHINENFQAKHDLKEIAYLNFVTLQILGRGQSLFSTSTSRLAPVLTSLSINGFRVMLSQG
jgi:hypothetical protein